MPEISSPENDFVIQLNAAVDQHLGDELFGVAELAEQMNMSRSNLLRKVKKLTGISVSQFIAQTRLKRAMDLLLNSSFNVSEVSHQTGFGSSSYFTKCFREHYGYPPGDAKKVAAELKTIPQPLVRKPPNYLRWILGSAALVMVIIAGLAFYFWPSVVPSVKEKSIAVLPFKNESTDSTNLYLINGLMESTLNNLQQLKELRVISRTSSEKYRGARKSIPEMAAELHVRYFVEGSGQKIGNKILLNIQLIDATSDRHLWAKQYRRETSDIFELQQEVARNIAEEIQIVITPDEERRIDKKPTADLVAYDLFLKGRNTFYKGETKDLEASIPYFKNATARDPKFALAYAECALVYYYLDLFRTDRKHLAELTASADNALLYDPGLPESLVAKALSFMLKKEYEQALPYFEKALALSPNSVLVLNFLSEYYNFRVPNTGKYLEYALQGLRRDMASRDSSSASMLCMQVSNAFLQTGFFDEAEKYINKSLAYRPDNSFAGYLKAFVLFAKDNNKERTKTLLLQELKKDTTRIDVVTQVAGIYYMMRDYKNAWRYYARLEELRKQMRMDIFANEDNRASDAALRTGHMAESKALLKRYKEFGDRDKSIYRYLFSMMYYVQVKENDKALDQLALFAKQDNYQYWVLLLPNDPLADNIRDLPRFKSLMKEIEKKFWDTHNQIKQRLEHEGLLQM